MHLSHLFVEVCVFETICFNQLLLFLNRPGSCSLHRNGNKLLKGRIQNYSMLLSSHSSSLSPFTKENFSEGAPGARGGRKNSALYS